MTGELDGDPIVLRRRSPQERALRLAAERARLRREGLPEDAVDLAEAALAEVDRERAASLSAWVTRVVGRWCADHRQELFELPVAVSQRLIVEAVVGYLVGFGLVRDTAAGEPGWHPSEWREAIPGHLHPDVVGEMERHRRMREVLVEQASRREWPSLNPQRRQWPSVEKGAVAGDG